VGAGKLLSSSCNSVGRNFGLSSLTRKCSRSASLRNGAGHTMAMAGKKEVGQGGENKRQEIKLSQADLMELEFGRLLGEPRQATLGKVSSSDLLLLTFFFFLLEMVNNPM
jgi:hypothetical protein